MIIVNSYKLALRKVLIFRADRGTPFDHIGELEYAYRGLQNVRQQLERKIRNQPPDITSRVNEVLNKRYKQVQYELSKLKSFLRSIGRNP